MERSAHAINVKGTALLSTACSANRRHITTSFGNRKPRQCRTPSRISPAISVRTAMNVTGGMVSTPILMNV